MPPPMSLDFTCKACGGLLQIVIRGDLQIVIHNRDCEYPAVEA